MRIGLCLATLLFGFVVSNSTLAAPPWKKASFKQQPRTNERLRLTDRGGPWMVYAASFAGESAKQEAVELATELRRQYKLKAYIHSEQYDFTKPVDGIGINRDRSPKKMKFYRSGTFDEYAVMVGDFESVDDPSLQKAMKTIKYARPESLTKRKDKTTRRFAGLRAFHKRLNGDQDKKRKGPMGMAFATPNPIVPRESYAPKGVDRFVLDMNKKVKHSLLDCPKKFSVRVATFRGTVVTDQRMVKEIEAGGQMENKLEQAAMKAHRLTEALRKRKVEAYEFHDRHESYVTVGSFDWTGQPRADGKQEINPAILKLIQKYGSTTSTGAMAKTKQLAGIPFDNQPWPIEVPKRSLATDYSRQRRLFR